MPKRRHKSKPTRQLKIAEARIKFLFDEAKQHFKEDNLVSDKYIKFARRIAMKHKIKLSSQQKKKFCRHCNKFLMPGVNCRVRIHKHRVIYYCMSCRHYMRHPVK